MFGQVHFFLPIFLTNKTEILFSFCKNFYFCRRNRPSGDAYVEVESSDDIAPALKQHKKNLGSRYRIIITY